MAKAKKEMEPRELTKEEVAWLKAEEKFEEAERKVFIKRSKELNRVWDKAKVSMSRMCEPWSEKEIGKLKEKFPLDGQEPAILDVGLLKLAIEFKRVPSYVQGKWIEMFGGDSFGCLPERKKREV